MRHATLIIGLLLAGPIAALEQAWDFSGWNGPAVRVRLFAPDDATPDTPIVIVMHGWSREAERYYEDWKPLAAEQGFIVVVPYFPVEDFPGANDYNLGHVFDSEGGTMRPEYSWTFAVIERLFDDVVARLDSAQTAYTLYGHSAGSQFVHRYLYYLPDARVARYIAANAGWYTMPDFDTEYPYGLKNAGLDENALRAALAKDVVLLLGREDIDSNDPDLRNTPEAKRQGANRFARGLAMYSAAERAAGQLGVEFNWRVVIIDGADHSNAKMAPAAASLIERRIRGERGADNGRNLAVWQVE